jgi:hypothetical protein
MNTRTRQGCTNSNCVPLLLCFYSKKNLRIMRIMHIIFPPKISHYASLSNHSKILRVKIMRIMCIMRRFFGEKHSLT